MDEALGKLIYSSSSTRASREMGLACEMLVVGRKATAGAAFKVGDAADGSVLWRDTRIVLLPLNAKSK